DADGGVLRDGANRARRPDSQSRARSGSTDAVAQGRDRRARADAGEDWPTAPMRPLTSLGLRTDGRSLSILDQTQLPDREVWLEASAPDTMVGHIQRLSVRGAPLIGVAAALSLAWLAEQGAGEKEWRSAAARLRAARPTAVNLMHAIDR